MSGERIEERRLLEEMRDVEIPLLAGQSVQVRHHLVHATVLGAQHELALIVADALEVRLHPAGDALGRLQRLLVAGVNIHVYQPGHDLVQRVERRPHLAALRQCLEQRLGISAQIAVAICLLTTRQFGYHRVATFAQRVVSCARIGQRDRGEIMSAIEVPAQFAVGLLPPAVRRRGRGQPGGHAKAVQQPIRIQRGQIGLVDLGLRLEETVRQAHLRHGKWHEFARLASHEIVSLAGRRIQHSQRRAAQRQASCHRRHARQNTPPARQESCIHENHSPLDRPVKCRTWQRPKSTKPLPLSQNIR